MALRIPRPDYLTQMPSIVRFDEARRGSTIPGPSYDNEIEINTPRHIDSPLVVDAYIEDYGPDFLIASKGSPVFVFSSPDCVYEVLVTKEDDFLKGDVEQFFSSLVGHILLTDEGKPHLLKRRAINHGVRGKVLNKYVSSTREAFALAGQTLGERKTVVDFARDFSQISAEAAMFGLQLRAADSRFPDAIQNINATIRQGFRNMKPGSLGVISQDLESIRSHVASLVSEWREMSESKTTLLDFLIESEHTSQAGEPDLAQVAFLLAAAIDTTTSLLASIIVALHLNPSYSKFLEEEAQATSNQGEDYRTLLSMEWHNAFINETLRLYPPFWAIPRIAVSDSEIGGYPVPRGSRVMVSPWLTHRNPAHFSQPEEFRPERWVGLAPHEIDKKKYYPFGMGGRICLGERQARLTASIFIGEYLASGLCVDGPGTYQIDDRRSFLAPTDSYVLRKH